MAEDFLTWTAAAQGRAIADGTLDPVTLAEASLAAIDAHPARDTIFARVTPDRALAEAGAARKRAQDGQRRGPLDGVAVSWKDLFDTAGVATEAGSALLAGRMPDRDAAVVATATAGGLVCLGKTHLSELAFSGLGYNPVTATPPNVNYPGGVPGGSSSGAAASVAFGLAAAGIGSDTGGSVRVPAAWNDLVGLKTTSGLLPLEGAVPLAAKFDTVGPLCRSVEDAALLLAALEGAAAPDLAGASVAGMRFLVTETLALDDVDDTVAGAFEDALRRLEAAGATIVRRPIPLLAEAHALSPVLFATEAYATWESVIEATPEKMFSEILKRFRGGRDFSGVEYVQAWQALDRHRAAYLEQTAGFDAVLAPTVPILPPEIERLKTDADYYTTVNLMTLRNTRIGNLMGLAGLTLPTGVPSVGLMLLTPPMTEARLLRTGAAAEAALAK